MVVQFLFTNGQDLLMLQQSLCLGHNQAQPTTRFRMSRTGKIRTNKSILLRDLKMSCGHRTRQEMLREQRSSKGKPMLFPRGKATFFVILKKTLIWFSTLDNEQSRCVPHYCFCSNSFSSLFVLVLFFFSLSYIV